MVDQEAHTGVVAPSGGGAKKELTNDKLKTRMKSTKQEQEEKSLVSYAKKDTSASNSTFRRG